MWIIVLVIVASIAWLASAWWLGRLSAERYFAQAREALAIANAQWQASHATERAIASLGQSAAETTTSIAGSQA